MANVKVFGAGSIGCHLTNACRSLDWSIEVLDVDPVALERMRKDIYPSRYGAWDESIQTNLVKDAKTKSPDLTIIGTPPDFHIEIALRELKESAPKIMLIEKPLCTPSLEGCVELFKLAQETGTKVLVGYNHNLTKNTDRAIDVLKSGIIGNCLSISAYVREYWGGIFAAHPWLDGPKDSYLGFWNRGGGSTGEHSHSISAWQYFAHASGAGKITEVNAAMQMVKTNSVDYDQLSFMQVLTENGLFGSVTQDVITKPTNKSLRVQGEKGFIEWIVNLDSSHDGMIFGVDGEEAKTEKFAKTRVDDFLGEIQHVDAIFKGKATAEESPISLERGLDTMMVIAAAYRSAQQKRTMKIDYSAGYHADAISPA